VPLVIFSTLSKSAKTPMITRAEGQAEVALCGSSFVVSLHRQVALQRGHVLVPSHGPWFQFFSTSTSSTSPSRRPDTGLDAFDAADDLHDALQQQHEASGGNHELETGIGSA
jgi:hypothetical protein